MTLVRGLSSFLYVSSFPALYDDKGFLSYFSYFPFVEKSFQVFFEDDCSFSKWPHYAEE